MRALVSVLALALVACSNSTPPQRAVRAERALDNMCEAMLSIAQRAAQRGTLQPESAMLLSVGHSACAHAVNPDDVAARDEFRRLAAKDSYSTADLARMSALLDAAQLH